MEKIDIPKVTMINPDHCYVETKDGVFLNSYGINVVFKPNKGKIQLGPDWDFSVTTGKFRNKMLGETIKETRKKLKLGIYELNEDLK